MSTSVNISQDGKSALEDNILCESTEQADTYNVDSGDWQTFLEKQLDEISEDGDSEIDQDVEKDMSEFNSILSVIFTRKLSTTDVIELIAHLSRENRKLRKIFTGFFYGYKNSRYLLKDYKDSLHSKTLEFENLNRKHYLLNKKLVETEARTNSQQSKSKEQNESDSFNKNPLEDQLAEDLERIKFLEEEVVRLRRLNHSTINLSSLLDVGRNHGDKRGLGYDGIDTSPINKEVKFVKAVGPSTPENPPEQAGTSESPKCSNKILTENISESNHRKTPTKDQHSNRRSHKVKTKNFTRFNKYCYYCKDKGHMQRDCKNRKMKNALSFVSKELDSVIYKNLSDHHFPVRQTNYYKNSKSYHKRNIPKRKNKIKGNTFINGDMRSDISRWKDAMSLEMKNLHSKSTYKLIPKSEKVSKKKLSKTYSKKNNPVVILDKDDYECLVLRLKKDLEISNDINVKASFDDLLHCSKEELTEEHRINLIMTFQHRDWLKERIVQVRGVLAELKIMVAPDYNRVSSSSEKQFGNAKSKMRSFADVHAKLQKAGLAVEDEPRSFVEGVASDPYAYEVEPSWEPIGREIEPYPPGMEAYRLAKIDFQAEWKEDDYLDAAYDDLEDHLEEIPEENSEYDSGEELEEDSVEDDDPEKDKDCEDDDESDV
ncbi:glutamic acid-rich protein-like [Papaver somniferum]|uniref:glutamic acid-rich protein-like n=1 Tax=Papaver somniferum TaxID=3469 RepID=UPI000E704395|nr:glutamic acid-rich protein-like [Papaver somniferum]